MALVMRMLGRTGSKLCPNSSTPTVLRNRLNTSLLSFTTSPTENNVLRFLQHEIDHERDNGYYYRVPHDEVHFRVKDKPGEQWIVLHRNYGREDIKVEATMLGLETEEEFDDDNGDDEKESKEHVPCHICLSVSIHKEGSTAPMVLGCFVYPHEIVVETVSVMDADSCDETKYKGPGVKEMNKDLQIALQEFLKERGIDENFSSFLYECMLNKTRKEYVSWLEGLKFFIQK
eukprot:TRINITY_DN5102_c0_g1_i1.p1 TRINITY_DN5102_c0_g1~~TRINITY_DN5102_c0_g1_i1.p1  ORF type:complete len:231 (-),score=39.43 TRINITY_DN5102_c0_g1_i1:70-762(-)